MSIKRVTGQQGLPNGPYRRLRLTYRPDFNPDALPKGDGPEGLADYNLVTMSDFKKNPAFYLVHSGHVPVVISRYGQMQGILLSIATYNKLLAVMRGLRKELAELRVVLSQLDPEYRKRIEPEDSKNSVNEAAPRWPLIGSVPYRTVRMRADEPIVANWRDEDELVEEWNFEEGDGFQGEFENRPALFPSEIETWD
jgi:PHD/YefM family antitoxin component YafN of YafNO toxin-antitoxin module